MFVICFLTLFVAPIWPAVSGGADTRSISLVADHFFGRGVSGRPCRTPCVTGVGRCFIETDAWPKLQPENCWYLQYYTARFTDKPLCAGPCSDIGGYGFKCAVSATSWDYCNPNSTHEVAYEARTLTDGELCAGACNADTRGVHACLKESGGYAACDPRAKRFIRALTPLGEPCLDSCELRDGWTGLQCHIEDSPRLQLCAPPARFYMRAESVHAV